MEWLTFLFEYIVMPLIIIGGIALCCFISAKILEIKKRTKDETTLKYLSMLDNSITTAVLATTQTYVDSLKRQGKFDLEAQKTAFAQTYDAVMNVLTDEAKKYITEAIGDLEVYVTNKIEAEVNLNK